MSGKMSRTKGHGYERAIANKLKPIYPEAKRHLESQAQEALGYDLDNTGPFLIQCKRYKQYAPINKIEEIKPSKGIHALITKADRKPDIICLYLDDFLEILKDIGTAHREM